MKLLTQDEIPPTLILITNNKVNLILPDHILKIIKFIEGRRKLKAKKFKTSMHQI